MSEENPFSRSHPRREKATRRAFLVWMAAYAAALLLVALAHTFGGFATSTTINANGIQTQQAKVTGEPQSSIADREIPQIVSFDSKG